jgi:hypothetical protein
MIQVNVQSDDISDIFVDVIDNNTQQPSAVLTGARFSHGQVRSVSIQEDGAGHGNLSWTATRADDPTQTKSSQESPSNLGTIFVEAT